MIGQYNTALGAQVWIQEAKATVPTYSKNRKKRMLHSSHIERRRACHAYTMLHDSFLNYPFCFYG